MKKFVDIKHNSSEYAVDFKTFEIYDKIKQQNHDLTNSRKAVLLTALDPNLIKAMNNNYNKLKKHFDKLKLLQIKPKKSKTIQAEFKRLNKAKLEVDKK